METFVIWSASLHHPIYVPDIFKDTFKQLEYAAWIWHANVFKKQCTSCCALTYNVRFLERLFLFITHSASTLVIQGTHIKHTDINQPTMLSTMAHGDKPIASLTKIMHKNVSGIINVWYCIEASSVDRFVRVLRFNYYAYHILSSMSRTSCRVTLSDITCMILITIYVTHTLT